MKNSHRYVRLALLLVGSVCLSATAYADVKVKRRTTMGAGQTFDQTVYIKGKRQRTERAELPVANVEQCDLRRSLEINLASKTYKVDSWQDATAPQTSPAGAQQAGTVRRGGVVTTTVTSRDTGERKKMFGYTARRVITTMVTESSPDACTPLKSKMETDAWYIDAEFALDCSTERYRNYRPVSARPDCSDRYEMKTVGAAQTGYPVYSKTTMFGENGEATHTFTDEVIELSQATLDAALFDVPADYREVKDSAEMYAQMAAAAAGSAGNSNGASDENGNAASGLGANVAQPPQAAGSVGAKKPGVVRLGLAAVKTGSVGDGMNAANLSAAVRNTLAEHLKSSTVELIQLEARLPSEIESEARQKDCDFVVYATASHKKGGGGFGKMFGKSTGLLGSVVPAAGMASGNAAVAAHVGASAVYTAAAMSADVKAKDELTLEVNLQAPGTAAPALSKQLKAKAKSDGDDILSPLVEQAAQAIMDAARR